MMPVLGKNLSQVSVVFLAASYKYILINRLIKVNKHIDSAHLNSLAPKGVWAPLSEESPERDFETHRLVAGKRAFFGECQLWCPDLNMCC